MYQHPALSCNCVMKPCVQLMTGEKMKKEHMQGVHALPRTTNGHVYDGHRHVLTQTEYNTDSSRC